MSLFCMAHFVRQHSGHFFGGFGRFHQSRKNIDVATRNGEGIDLRSEEHTSELQSLTNLVCRLLLEKKKKKRKVRCDDLAPALKLIAFIGSEVEVEEDYLEDDTRVFTEQADVWLAVISMLVDRGDSD